jgi:hypothetical protein
MPEFLGGSLSHSGRTSPPDGQLDDEIVAAPIEALWAQPIRGSTACADDPGGRRSELSIVVGRQSGADGRAQSMLQQTLLAHVRASLGRAIRRRPTS